MEAVCMKIVEMSIAASWLIVVVILLRFLLAKAPKGFRYLLWGLVAVRLVCPFAVESPFSLVPDIKPFAVEKEQERDESKDVVTVPEQDVIVPDTQPIVPDVRPVVPDTTPGVPPVTPEITPDIQPVVPEMTPDIPPLMPEEKDDTVVTETVGEKESNRNTLLDILLAALPWTWVTDGILMVLYMIISYVYLRKKVSASIAIDDHVYICDEIQSPFILGFIRPRIYVPSHIEKEKMAYIVAHEKEHLRCLDYLWKPLGFAILAIHWFNPFVWVAYILMCRDLELACDERVIRTMNGTQKKQYSETLLSCSSPGRYIAAYPIAFGEIGVKERIRRVLSYKKPTIWIVGGAAILCVVVALCFLTDPVGAAPAANTEVENEETDTESELESAEPDTDSETESAEPDTDSETESAKPDTDSETESEVPDTDSEPEDTESENTKPEEPTTGPIRVEKPGYEYQINLPSGVTIGDQRTYQELEGIFFEVDDYRPLEKYPYAKEDMLWLAPGWITHVSGGVNAQLTYSKSVGLYVPDWDCEFQDYEEYLGVKLCTVIGDVYSYDIWGKNPELHYNSGYTYYWALIFENPAYSGEEGQANWIFLNQDCFTKAEALTIAKSFVPNFTVEKETPEYDNYEKELVYDTTADINHDGIDDLVRTIVRIHWEFQGIEEEENYSYVEVYLGRGNGEYNTKPLYTSDAYARTMENGGAIVLTEKDGRDYLMTSVMYEGESVATYKYMVFYLDENGCEVFVDAEEVDFYCVDNGYLWYEYEDALREDLALVLQARMQAWIDKGTLLIAMDPYTSVYRSSEEALCEAKQYYDLIWARTERTDYGSSTSYKIAYKDIVNIFLDQYGEYASGLRFSLIHFNDDKTPELVVSYNTTEISMYTYHAGKVYPLMTQWYFGAGGNPGYFYEPKENVLFNRNNDFAGAIVYLTFMKINEDYEFVHYHEESLRYQYIKDLNGDGIEGPDEGNGETYYFYGETEITEEKFKSYFIGDVDEDFPYDELLPNDKYIEISADKTAAEFLAELSK